MQKSNISTHSAQRVDEKNDAIRLVMFTPKVMVIKVLCNLCWIQKKTDPVWARYLNASKVLFEPFTRYYGLCSSDQPLANCQHLIKQDFTSPLLTQLFLFNYSTHNISRTVMSKAYLNIPFAARNWWDLPHVIKDMAQAVTNFLLLPGKNKNN